MFTIKTYVSIELYSTQDMDDNKLEKDNGYENINIVKNFSISEKHVIIKIFDNDIENLAKSNFSKYNIEKKNRIEILEDHENHQNETKIQ